MTRTGDREIGVISGRIGMYAKDLLNFFNIRDCDKKG